MKAVEIRNHFLSVADWVAPEKTVDQFILGDPQKEVKTTLVTWISNFSAVRTAVEGRFDMLITHEPTFWEHSNEEENMESSETALKKKKFIEQSGRRP